MSEQDEQPTKQPTMTFNESAAEIVIRQFGWVLDDDGTVVDYDDKIAIESTDGKPINISELAGIVKLDGRALPLRDGFVSKVNHVKRRQEGESNAE